MSFFCCVFMATKSRAALLGFAVVPKNRLGHGDRTAVVQVGCCLSQSPQGFGQETGPRARGGGGGGRGGRGGGGAGRGDTCGGVRTGRPFGGVVQPVVRALLIRARKARVALLRIHVGATTVDRVERELEELVAVIEKLGEKLEPLHIRGERNRPRLLIDGDLTQVVQLAAWTEMRRLDLPDDRQVRRRNDGVGRDSSAGRDNRSDGNS